MLYGLPADGSIWFGSRNPGKKCSLDPVLVFIIPWHLSDSLSIIKGSVGEERVNVSQSSDLP